MFLSLSEKLKPATVLLTVSAPNEPGDTVNADRYEGSAHRIHKQQFLLGIAGRDQGTSLKELWDLALGPTRDNPRLTLPAVSQEAPFAPELKALRPASRLTEARVQLIRSLRYAQKVVDGRGLYLLVAPNGGRYWRHNYRIQGKGKTLALGVYPVV